MVLMGLLLLLPPWKPIRSSRNVMKMELMALTPINSKNRIPNIYILDFLVLLGWMDGWELENDRLLVAADFNYFEYVQSIP